LNKKRPAGSADAPGTVHVKVVVIGWNLTFVVSALKNLSKENFNMPSKAIEKIQSEMTKNNTNSYIQVVGGFLLQHLSENPQDAEKINAADKTIGKSLNEMEKAARKKKVGNYAVLTDQEGFEVVLKYFGIEGQPAPMPSATVMPPAAHSPAPSPSFNVSLEDLLL
jgi:hypothetical protein